jgi:hypothetical protein
MTRSLDFLSPSSTDDHVGAIARSRCVARVQAPESAHPQMDYPALLTVQGRLGLDHSTFGDVHCNFYTLCCRVSAERTFGGHAQQKK